MPKLKTNRGAAKRFKKTASGGFKFKKAFHRHYLTHKSSNTKRGMRHKAMLHPSDVRAVARLLCMR